MKKKPLLDDSLHATRAAVEEGMVRGGGALLRATSALAALKLKGGQFGVNVVRRCGAPATQITLSLELKASSPRRRLAPPKAGGINSTKVTRTPLQTTSSITSLMLPIEPIVCGVVEEPESN